MNFLGFHAFHFAHKTVLLNMTFNTASFLFLKVHTGLLPQDILDQESETVKRLLQDDDDFNATYNVSNNAMKQYKRTRPEATHDGEYVVLYPL